MKFRLSRVIKRKGQAVAVLNLFMAVSIIGVLGIFSVELSRYMLAQDQLKSTVEAAALCCQTVLASSGSPNNANSQSAAEQAGLSLFQQNTILGQSLTLANLVSVAQGQPKPQFDLQPGEAQICFQFLDPVTRLPAANVGTFIQATGAYSYVPYFGQFLGLGNAQFTCQSTANSGIPQLDLVFVYDVSGAANTQTPTTYVQRLWNNPTGIDYLIPSPVGSPPTTTTSGGPLAPFCNTTAPNQGPNPTTPQNLDNSANCTSSQLNYAEVSGAATQSLTGAQAFAAPPGNYPYNGTINTMAYWVNGAHYTGWVYAPCTNLITPGGLAIPLSQYVALPCRLVCGKATIPVPPPFDAVTTNDSIAYIPASAAGNWLRTPATAHQTPYILSNNGTNNSAQITVILGGGSSFASAPPYPVPTGPLAFSISSNSNSPVASVLSGNTYDAYGHSYTDAITNIDNSPIFESTTITYNGKAYKFPSLGALVEASRGNLESLAVAQAAGVHLNALGLTQAELQSGYYAAYVQAALASVQPMNTVANATIAFMNQLATVSDVHFGCLAFNDYTGTSATSAVPVNTQTSYSPDFMQAAIANNQPSNNPSDPYNIASSYPDPSINMDPNGAVDYTTTGTYLMPNIPLDPNGNTTQATITNVLPTIHTWGNCDVAGALSAALTELSPQVVGSSNLSPARTSANKAIILITDQAPNLGTNGDTGTSAVSDAVSVAKLANQAGIPIYCVSIAQSGNDSTSEDAAYNDNSGGIAATAGHGSKYYRVDWSTPSATQSALTSVFANIARQLVSVVR